MDGCKKVCCKKKRSHSLRSLKESTSHWALAQRNLEEQNGWMQNGISSDPIHYRSMKEMEGWLQEGLLLEERNPTCYRSLCRTSCCTLDLSNSKELDRWQAYRQRNVLSQVSLSQITK